MWPRCFSLGSAVSPRAANTRLIVVRPPWGGGEAATLAWNGQAATLGGRRVEGSSPEVRSGRRARAPGLASTVEGSSWLRPAGASHVPACWL